MHFNFSYVALSILVATANAAPLSGIETRQNGNVTKASLPQSDSDPVARAQAITVRRDGFLYAPSLIGNASFHIGGTLGGPRIQSDVASWLVDRNKVNISLEADLAVASAAISKNLGLRSLDDYATVLYQGQFEKSVPGGEAPGMLTNYTQDLLFSMERLSLNPFPLVRLKATDSVPFALPDSITRKVTTLSLSELKLAGRLFVVDHSYQLKYPTSGKFGAAVTAYFFIHPRSGDFLPLAIKTNTGSNLVYTPLDSPNDWLLAKIMFNANDLFHSQTFHLVASHDIAEAIHEAALRTLSDNHPVMVVLERLMHQEYAIRPIGESNLFNSGGPFDQVFYQTSQGARQYVTEFYPKFGAFQAGYLETDLRARGLIHNPGPSFKSFPYYTDAVPIRNSLRSFFTSFVGSYYNTEAVVDSDLELQAWFLEANNAAKVIDFPQSVNKKTLIEVLTQFAFLSGASHHHLNTGDPVATRATLPFHPAALYAPLPTTKNITSADLLTFLPPPKAALTHIAIFAAFNRPHFESQNRTLAYAFSDESVLGRLNAETSSAADVFLKAMKDLSAKIRARSFGADGLSLGMPFVWRALDPGTIPFFFAV